MTRIFPNKAPNSEKQAIYASLGFDIPVDQIQILQDRVKALESILNEMRLIDASEHEPQSTFVPVHYP